MERSLNYEQAKNRALKILEYRSHSEREMRDKLKRAGAGGDDIERVLEFLREYRFVDDGDFAKRYARDLKNLRKLGKRRVRAELIKKGIAAELADDAVSELDWETEDVLTPLVRKKLAGDFEQKSRDRCMRYFITRGYGFDEIKRAIENVKAEEENGL